MRIQSARLLLACTLIGIISPVPWCIAYVVAVYAIKPPEWAGPGIALLFLLGTSWGSSAVSGWICGRRLVRPANVACAFVANSSGWLGLLLLLVPIVEREHLSREDVIAFLAIGLLISFVGLFITWWTMKLAVAAQSPNAKEV